MYVDGDIKVTFLTSFDLLNIATGKELHF